MSAAPAVIPEEVVVRRRWTKGLFSQPLAVVGARDRDRLAARRGLRAADRAYDPLAQDFPLTQAPSREHLFGTDELGAGRLEPRDLRCPLRSPLALLLVALAMALGSILGAMRRVLPLPGSIPS